MNILPPIARPHPYTKKSTSAGFEPARAMPNRFLVYRLNRSATTCLKCPRACIYMYT